MRSMGSEHGESRLFYGNGYEMTVALKGTCGALWGLSCSLCSHYWHYRGRGHYLTESRPLIGASVRRTGVGYIS